MPVSSLVLRRNRLIYPGGSPRLSIPGVGGKVQFAGVVVGANNMIDLSTGQGGVPSGTGALTPATEGTIGPSVKFAANSYVKFSNKPTVGVTAYTQAAIFKTGATISGYIFSSTDGGSAGTALGAFNASKIDMVVQTINSSTFGFTVAANTPYFFIGGGYIRSSDSNWTFSGTLVNLRTGQIQQAFDSPINSVGAMPTGSGNYAVGIRTSAQSSWSGSVSAVLHSTGYAVNPDEQLLIAQDPWSLWFPTSGIELLKMLKAPSAAGVVTVASVSNTPTYANRTNSTITAPTGITNGDLLVAILHVGDPTALPALTVSPPAGWTEVTNSPSAMTDGSYTIALHIFYKVASSESGNYTFSHTAADTEGYMYRLTGCDTSTPIDITPVVQSAVISGGGQNGKTTTYATTTTVTDGALLIFAESDWDAVGAGVISGSTPTITARRTGTISLISDGTLATAGATGVRTRTNGNGSTAVPWTSIVVAIRPSAGTSFQQFLQSINASLSSTVARSNLIGKLVPVSSTTATTRRAGVSKSVPIASTTTTTFKKAVSKIASIASASTTSVAKSISKPIAIAASSVVSTVKQARKIASVTASSVTAVVKGIAKSIAVSSASSVAVNATKAFLITISTGVSTTVSATRRALKSLTATASSAVSIRKGIAKSIASTTSILVSASASLVQGIKQFFQTISVTSTSSVAMTRNRGFSRVISAVVGSSTSVTKRIGKSITLSLTSGISIAWIRNTIRQFLGGPTPSRTVQAPAEVRSVQPQERERMAIVTEGPSRVVALSADRDRIIVLNP